MNTEAMVPGPDDDEKFFALVARMDTPAGPLADEFADQLTVRPVAKPTSQPAVAATPAQTGAEFPRSEPQRMPIAALVSEPVAATGDPLVRPERPALVEPTQPRPPDLGRADQTGHMASLAGYVMSVGVGAFGQIMFLGTWLALMLPSPGNWIAAGIGAAFAEIGMIGAGNSSLTKRRDGGRWKLLFAVACFVCAGAVTMQVAHWLPKGLGVALVFGLASFVGFLIHMTIEHSKIRDHEDRMAKYAKELAAFQAEQQARYEEDLAKFEAARADEQRRADELRRERERHHAATAPATEPPAESTARSKGRKRQATAGTQATQDDALRIGVEQRVSTPGPLRDALRAEGYDLPRSSSTLDNWCRKIRQELDISS